MLKCREFDKVLNELSELKKLGEVEFVYPTSVKVAPFKDSEDGTYVGILKVDCNNKPRYKLFKVVFNWRPLERKSDVLAYMCRCLMDYDLM